MNPVRLHFTHKFWLTFEDAARVQQLVNKRKCFGGLTG